MSNSTYLSPGVRDLLLSPSNSTETNEDFLRLNSVSIDEIRRCLIPTDYRTSVLQLNEKVLPQIEQMFSKTTDEEFRNFYGEEKFSGWLSNANVKNKKKSLSRFEYSVINFRTGKNVR